MSNRNESGEVRDRRQFLKEAGTALGLGWALPVLGACDGAAALQSHTGTTTGKQLAMVVDVAKCENPEVRRVAIEACHLTHNVPHITDPEEEIKWIWEAAFEHALPDEVHDQTPEAQRDAPVLVMCNHCENPPCVRVCPTQATWKRESDGIVMMDMHRCIGCRYCMAACPYGSRSFNWRDPRPNVETGEDGNFASDYPTRTRGVVEKCTFCADRLKDGLLPACVEAAGEVEAGALVFGDVSDPDSEISQILRERPTVVRRPELGTGPKVYYIV